MSRRAQVPLTASPSTRSERGDERGSALVTATLVLALLTGLGIGLLFVGQLEMMTSRADARAKVAFYIAEAGLEDAREQLRLDIKSGTSLSSALAAAAGPNGQIDFQADNLGAVFDGNGKLTGFTGVGDDVPLRPATGFGEGTYVAFLTNDPAEGAAALTDNNDRLAVTSLGVEANGAVEVIETITERNPFPRPPATITLLGPDPMFEGGTAGVGDKLLSGNDCQEWGGGPLSPVPVVGVVDDTAESLAENGVHEDLTFREGSQNGSDTVDDFPGLSPPPHPLWNDCGYLAGLAIKVKGLADVVGDSTTPWSAFGSWSKPKVVYIEGDYQVTGDRKGGGLLWVTGQLRVTGKLRWRGVIFAVGVGEVEFTDEVGELGGAFIVADLSGPDDLLGTADDCSGPDGISGTPDDGYASASWDVQGTGNGTTEYCSTFIDLAVSRFPFEVVSFRQR